MLRSVVNGEATPFGRAPSCTWHLKAVTASPSALQPGSATTMRAQMMVPYSSFRSQSIFAMDSVDAQRVLSHIAYDPALVLIAIDTLSRALAGGDENGSRDMGQFVINCDQVRQQTGAHVCVLHHLGKDESRGARGHSLLKAALDTEITVTKTGRVGLMEVTKQRDYPDGEIFGFASKSVDLGDGKSSFVVVPSDVPEKRPKRQKLNPKHELARRALSALAGGSKGKPAPSDWELPPYVATVEVDLWRDELFNTGVLDKHGKRARQDFWDTKRALAAKNIIGEREGVVWLRDAPSIVESGR
jgi:hypothetical protein